MDTFNIFLENHLYLEELTVKKTSVSLQTISKAGINENKHNFTLVQVFGLPSSTGLFGFPNKVVTGRLLSN